MKTFVVHIPKCAGTTILTGIANSLNPNKEKFLLMSDHGGLASKFPEKVDVINTDSFAAKMEQTDNFITGFHPLINPKNADWNTREVIFRRAIQACNVFVLPVRNFKEMVVSYHNMLFSKCDFEETMMSDDGFAAYRRAVLQKYINIASVTVAKVISYSMPSAFIVIFDPGVHEGWDDKLCELLGLDVHDFRQGIDSYQNLGQTYNPGYSLENGMGIFEDFLLSTRFPTMSMLRSGGLYQKVWCDMKERGFSVSMGSELKQWLQSFAER